MLCRVFGSVVPLCCSCCGLLSGFGLRCRMLCCVFGCCAPPRCRVLFRPALCCCVLCCFVSLRLVPLLAVSPPRTLSVALGSCAPRRAVLWCFFTVFALCCLCFAVVCSCVLLFAAVRCAVCALVVLLFVPCPPCSLQCCTTPSWCACVVLFVRSVLFPAPGPFVSCCKVCCLLPIMMSCCAAARCACSL